MSWFCFPAIAMTRISTPPKIKWERKSARRSAKCALAHWNHLLDFKYSLDQNIWKMWKSYLTNKCRTKYNFLFNTLVGHPFVWKGLLPKGSSAPPNFFCVVCVQCAHNQRCQLAQVACFFLLSSFFLLLCHALPLDPQLAYFCPHFHAGHPMTSTSRIFFMFEIVKVICNKKFSLCFTCFIWSLGFWLVKFISFIWTVKLKLSGN